MEWFWLWFWKPIAEIAFVVFIVVMFFVVALAVGCIEAFKDWLCSKCKRQSDRTNTSTGNP